MIAAGNGNFLQENCSHASRFSWTPSSNIPCHPSDRWSLPAPVEYKSKGLTDHTTSTTPSDTNNISKIMASWKVFALVLVLLAVGATAAHRPMLIFKGGSHFGSGGHGALAALLAAGAIAKLFHGHGLSAGGFSAGARSAPRAHPQEIHRYYLPHPMMYSHPEWM